MELKIDPEFKKQIPPLKDEERSMLERQLKQDGCRDPLVVWNMTILDGHNRYEICTTNSIVYDVHSIDLPDREAAMDWIDRNQIGRRNLSKDDFRLIVGRIYNRTKKRPEEFKGNQHTKSAGAQNDHKQTTAAEVIAKDFDISPVSVRRHGKFAEAVDEIQKQQPELERGEAIETAKEQTRANKPKKEREVMPGREACQPKTSWAMDYAEMAISQLERINRNDPKRIQALNRVISWINEELKL